MNLIIAIILFLFTALSLYVIFLMARRGRRKGMAAPAGDQSAEIMEEGDEGKKEKSSKRQKWGVDKDAYCYPDINDVMGFEFVKVVNVPEGLLGIQKAAEAAETEPPKKEWSQSQGVSGLKIVTTGQNDHVPDEDTPYPDQQMPVRNQPVQTQQPNETETTEATDADVSEVEGYSEQDLESMQSMQGRWGEWPRDDERDLDLYTEEQLSELVTNNEERIEQPRHDEEQDRVANEIKSINDAMIQSEHENFEDDINDLIGDADDSDMQPGAGDIPDEGDIPEI